MMIIVLVPWGADAILGTSYGIQGQVMLHYFRKVKPVLLAGFYHKNWFLDT